MAKANSSFSEVQIARRIKEGRGVDAAVARLLGARARSTLGFSPIKNARRQPSVLNKSRWNSEVITGSIHRSHYDKYSKNTQLLQR